jgi:hypothetical protein
MADTTIILLAGPTIWKIVLWPGPKVEPVQIPADAKPADIAAAVSDKLRQEGLTGKPAALGIPSDWCLSASISIADLPRNDSKALLFRLEENLPLPAESVVAEFIIHKDSALGVCARVELLAPLVSALEAADVPIQSIFPTALATAAGFARSASHPTCMLLCKELDSPTINLLTLADGNPTHWALVPATQADVKMQLDLLSTELGHIPHIHSIDLEPALVDALMETTAQVIDVESKDGVSLASSFAADVLRGGTKSVVEFRRNQLAAADPLRLYRVWMHRSLVAGIALLLSLTLVFLVRAHRYKQVESASTGEMITAFHQHFPGWETPINVRAIVDSQYRQATGSDRLSSTGTSAHDSALTRLHDVLLPLMAEDHVQISRMSFRENAFELAGKLQSYDQLDALSKLAKVDGLVISPPQAHREADGSWTFLLQGSRPPETSAD